jgi:hypothetical protein
MRQRSFTPPPGASPAVRLRFDWGNLESFINTHLDEAAAIELLEDLSGPINQLIREADRQASRPTMAFDARPTRELLRLNSAVQARFHNEELSRRELAELRAALLPFAGDDTEEPVEYPRPAVIDWAQSETAAGSTPKPDQKNTRDRCDAAVGFVVTRHELREACRIVTGRTRGRPRR